MGDRHRKLSLHLWEILDGRGLSERVREMTVHQTITKEILFTVGSNLTGENRDYYHFGSSCEGTTTLGLQSDIDMLLCNWRIPVVADLHDAPAGDCLLPIWDRNTAPGYVKLQRVCDSSPQNILRDSDMTYTTSEVLTDRMTSIDNGGNVTMENATMYNNFGYVHKLDLKRHMELHGPAITQPISSKTIPVDRVYALRCRSWPLFALEWLQRERQNNWPSVGMIQKAETLGCFFVPAGHPLSREHKLEWRTSFSLQERELMFSLNNVQHKCCVLLKYARDIIKAQIGGDSITSYHLKTCLFYCIENTRPGFWCPDNLVRCLLHCLGTLLHWLRQGNCPNFFVKQQNMFAGKLNFRLQKQISVLLQGLLSENCRFLFQIPCDYIGNQLTAAFTPLYLNINQTVSEDGENIQFQYQYNETCKHYDTMKVIHGVALSYLQRFTIRDNVNTTKCIRAHERLLSELYSINTVTEHTEDETRRALQYIIPFLHTSLACQLASQAIQTANSTTDLDETNYTQIQEHLSKGHQSDLLSSRLKQAAIYYKLEDYERVESILASAENDLHPITSNFCSCDISFCHVGKCGHGVSPENMSTVEVLRRCVGCCVRFLPTEMDITPAALQYEMFRSVGTPARRRVYPDYDWSEDEHYWYDCSVVSATVFLHYMKCLLYIKMKNIDQLSVAIRKLQNTLGRYDTMYHPETTLNLLAWVARQVHDTDTALLCLQGSMMTQPWHNAAKWQIAEMCLEQLTGICSVDSCSCKGSLLGARTIYRR
ncbi:MAG: hypothetical protein ABW185_24315 [Sedimenticola sp.]